MNYPEIVREALREDIGRGDITTQSIIPKDKFVRAALLAKEDCVVCGLSFAGSAFRLIDRNIKFIPKVKEGAKIKRGKVIALVLGRAQSILTAERVALNFISLLSGIATKTREYVDAVKPHKVKIMDTRKTIPGLRLLERYAVRIGGGFNHRLSLDEMVLIKGNHLAASCVVRRASCVREIIKTARKQKPQNAKLEIEVKNLKEFKEALEGKPDIIMLDNMNIKDIKEAVRIRNYPRLTTHDSRLKLEASGGISLKNVKKIASTGVDMISIGDLTHSVKSIDISLEII